MANILAICSNEQHPTKCQLMINASLNTMTVEKYLDILIPSGMLVQPGANYFQTSEKGRLFLEHYKRVKSLLSEINAIQELSVVASRHHGGDHYYSPK
jgi:predicted transcriptional regulator